MFAARRCSIEVWDSPRFLEASPLATGPVAFEILIRPFEVSGNKAELQRRLEDVFETNDRGWAPRGVPAISEGQYLASGSFRDVFLVTYTKGPRKAHGIWDGWEKCKGDVLFESLGELVWRLDWTLSWFGH